MTTREIVAVFNLVNAVAWHAGQKDCDSKKSRMDVRVAFDRLLMERPWYERWADALLNRKRMAVFFEDERASLLNNARIGPPGYDAWTGKMWGQ